MADNLFAGVPLPSSETSNPFDKMTPGESAVANTALPNKTLMLALSQVNSSSHPSLQLQEESLQTARDIIESGQEQTTRNRIVADKAIRRMSTLNELKMNTNIMSPQNAAAIDAAYTNVANWDYERKARIAIEERAIENLQDMAARDPVQAQVLADNLVVGGAYDTHRKYLTNMALLNQRAEELDSEYQNEGWGKSILNFVLGVIPTNYLFARSGIVKDAGAGFGDFFLAGENLRKQSSKIWEMEPEDFAKYVASDGELMRSLRDNATTLGAYDPGLAKSLLGSLTSQSEDDRAWANTWGIVDAGVLVPFGKIASVPKQMLRAGARKERLDLLTRAADVLEKEGEAAVIEKTGISAAEIKQAQSIRSVDAEAGSDYSVSQALDLATRIEAAKRALAELPGVLKETQRLSPSELQSAYENLVDNITVQIGKHGKDFALKTEVLADGNTIKYVDYIFGKTSGGGYARKELAENAAKSRGIYGEAFRDESGQWFVRSRKNLTEYGFTTETLHQPTQGFLSNMLGRWTRSSSRISDVDLHGKGVAAGSSISRAQRILGRMLDDTFKGIDHDSQGILQDILLVGANKKKWFTDDEFKTLVQRGRKRDATVEEIDAYQKIRLYNDMDYVLRNDSAYLQKAIKGNEQLKFSTHTGQEFNLEGRVSNSPTIASVKDRAYNLTDNIHYTKQGTPLTEESLTRLKAKGYVLFETEEPVLLPTGVTVKKFFIKRSDLEVTPLSRNQLPYSEGGHRLYTDKYFVKQASYGVQPDTGTKFLKNPAVFRTAKNVAEGKKWAAVMNEARLAVKERSFTAAQLDELVFKGDTAFPSGDEFVQALKDGAINLEHEFETLFDREMPSVYRGAKDDVDHFFDPDETGFNGYYRTTGRLYTSHKGEVLRDTAGEIAETVDPYEALSTSLKQATRQTGLFNYKQESITRFAETFRNDLDVPKGANSDYELFSKGTIRQDVSPERRHFIESQRQAMRNVMGFETPFEKGLAQTWRNSLERILGEGTNKGRVAAYEALNWVSQKNPLSFIRGMAFDSKLGLLNVGQFFIQSSTMFSALALSPRSGMKGMMSAVPLWSYLLSKGREDVLDTLAKRGVGKLSGFGSEAEFKEYARSIYKSGFMDMNGSHIMVGENGPAAVYGSFGDKANRVREGGRFFFYSAETMNRLVAYRIAWDEALAKGLRPGQEGWHSTVLGIADDYSFNMTHESAAWWQKGVLSIPTQFWAYNVRMMDAMFGSRFTKAQRLSLMSANFALAGTGGIPLMDWLSSFVADTTAEEPNIDSIKGTLTRGLLDRAAYEINGADVRIGEKVGTGSWLTNTVKDAFGMGEYGERSFAEFTGGATFSILKNIGGTAYNAVKYAFAETGGDMGTEEIRDEELLKLASEVSSFGNLTKAIMAANYGIYKSKNGTLYHDLPRTDAFYIALGFKPQQIETLSHMMKYNKKNEEIIKDASRQLTKWRSESFTNPDTLHANMRKANALMRLLPPEVRTRVIKQTNKLTNDDFYNHIEKKFNEEIRIEGNYEDGTTN